MLKKFFLLFSLFILPGIANADYCNTGNTVIPCRMLSSKFGCKDLCNEFKQILSELDDFKFNKNVRDVHQRKADDPKTSKKDRKQALQQVGFFQKHIDEARYQTEEEYSAHLIRLDEQINQKICEAEAKEKAEKEEEEARRKEAEAATENQAGTQPIETPSTNTPQTPEENTEVIPSTSDNTVINTGSSSPDSAASPAPQSSPSPSIKSGSQEITSGGNNGTQQNSSLNGCGSDSGLFSELLQKGAEIFRGLREIIFIVAGFGILAVAVGGFFGNLNWKWLGAIIIGLMIIASTGELINMIVGCDTWTSSAISDTLK